MSDSTWFLSDVDAGTRQRAGAEATRLGMSLADYLTDIVLKNALAEQAHEQSALVADSDAAPSIGETFAIRHQIKALERRVGSSVTSLDAALNALDGSLFDLTARVGDLEAQTGNTGHSLVEQLKDLQASLADLRRGLSDIETDANRASEDNDVAHATLVDACAELERRLNDIETLSRTADHTAAQLADAQHAYRLSVARDLESLSRETHANLNVGLDQVRAAANKAAAHADAAAEHLISELQALRQAMDARLSQGAAETKHRMQAAFAEHSERINVLAERVSANERQSERHAEHVRAQLTHAEGNLQKALEEGVLSLRRGDAVLAADIVKVGENNRVALDALRSDLAAETAAMLERQLNATARLAAAEGKIASITDHAAAQQDEIDRRLVASNVMLRDALDQIDTTISEQFDAAASRATELEQDIAHVRRTLGAEINRVEACTLAALEKQVQDRLAGDAATGRAADEHASTTRTAIDDMRRRLEEQLAALRGEQTNARARMDQVSTALANDGPLATAVSATAEEVASLRSRVLGMQAADRDIGDRISRLESAEPRGLADVQARLAELEERQAGALHRLRNDIAAFVAENERRLSLLEDATPDLAAPFAAIELRLAELEHRDIGVAFAELRARIEDRILGVEQRNVRTLEQLSDTVALIERRFNADEDQGVQRSA